MTNPIQGQPHGIDGRAAMNRRAAELAEERTELRAALAELEAHRAELAGRVTRAVKRLVTERDEACAQVASCHHAILDHLDRASRNQMHIEGLEAQLASWHGVVIAARAWAAASVATIEHRPHEEALYAAVKAAERVRTQETAGRCGDVAPSLSLLASRTRPTCRLTAGHPGWHRGDDDSEWTMTRETQP